MTCMHTPDVTCDGCREEALALLAERRTEALEGILALLLRGMPTYHVLRPEEHNGLLEQGRLKEREEIVAWLRSWNGPPGSYGLLAADEIEKGAHRFAMRGEVTDA